MLDDQMYANIINLFSGIILVFAVIVSFSRNSDLFSPVKIYVMFNTFFYLDIFFSSYAHTVGLIYLLQCLLILVVSFAEPRKSSVLIKPGRPLKSPSKIIALVWILSLVPAFNQLQLISSMGGIVALVGNIGLRVSSFEGRGYLLIINSFIIVLNLIHFIVMIQVRRKKYYVSYLLHFSILVLMGLLSGSRSFIAMPILASFLIYSYYNRVRVWRVIVFFVGIASLVAVLGTLRNTVSTSDGEISVEGYHNAEGLENSQFRYGLIPLEIITRSNLRDLQYGSTYLSLITNFIPREIFPAKLVSGGVYFTRAYADNAWGGDSHLATGAVTEGIINFGFFFGTIIGLAGIFIFYLLGFFAYRKMLENLHNELSLFYLIGCIYFILLAGRYSYSEFSYVLFNYMLTIVFPLLFFLVLYKLIPRKNSL